MDLLISRHVATIQLHLPAETNSYPFKTTHAPTGLQRLYARRNTLPPEPELTWIVSRNPSPPSQRSAPLPSHRGTGTSPLNPGGIGLSLYSAPRLACRWPNNTMFGC